MNWQKWRTLFPVTEQYIYLNHAGVAPISLRTKNAMNAFLAHTTHHGFEKFSPWTNEIKLCRQLAAQLIGATTSEIAFTKNTTQGLILAANGIRWKRGDNIIITKAEFPANVYPWWNLKDLGVETRIVPEINGRIFVDDIKSAIDNNTRGISISHVGFASGFRNDLRHIGQICKSQNIWFIVDAIQSLGVLALDVKDCHIDILVADGHKWLLASEGAAIFYCNQKKIDQLRNINVGWASVIDEYDFLNLDLIQKPNASRFEEGSHNTVGICGLKVALDLLLEIGIDQIETRVLNLTDHLINRLKAKDYRIFSPHNYRSERSGIVVFQTDRFSTDDLHQVLVQHQVACTNRGGMLRLAPHFYNTYQELDFVVDILP